MNRKLSALALAGALALTLALPAGAVCPLQFFFSWPWAVQEETPALPDSLLYCGAVQQLVEEDGVLTQLWMDSEQSGPYTMNLSEQTVWIDGTLRAPASSAALQEGDEAVVFHSPVTALSLPPQSAALAVVLNPPQDGSAVRLHTVEEVSLDDGQLTITTDQGGLLLRADETTLLSRYDGQEAVSLKDIQPGSRVVAWYTAVLASYPGQARAEQLILLPE